MLGQHQVLGFWKGRDGQHILITILKLAVVLKAHLPIALPTFKHQGGDKLKARKQCAQPCSNPIYLYNLYKACMLTATFWSWQPKPFSIKTSPNIQQMLLALVLAGHLGFAMRGITAAQKAPNAVKELRTRVLVALAPCFR